MANAGCEAVQRNQGRHNEPASAAKIAASAHLRRRTSAIGPAATSAIPNVRVWNAAAARMAATSKLRRVPRSSIHRHPVANAANIVSESSDVDRNITQTQAAVAIVTPKLADGGVSRSRIRRYANQSQSSRNS